MDLLELQVRLTLTRRGRLQFRQIAALALEWEAELLDALAPAERTAFDRILTKLMREPRLCVPGLRVRRADGRTRARLKFRSYSVRRRPIANAAPEVQPARHIVPTVPDTPC